MRTTLEKEQQRELAEFNRRTESAVEAAEKSMQRARSEGRSEAARVRACYDDAIRTLSDRIPMQRQVLGLFSWSNPNYRKALEILEADRKAGVEEVEKKAAALVEKARRRKESVSRRAAGERPEKLTRFADDREQVAEDCARRAGSAMDQLARVALRRDEEWKAAAACGNAGFLQVGEISHPLPDGPDLCVPLIMPRILKRGLVVQGGSRARQWVIEWLGAMMQGHAPGDLRVTLIDPEGLGKAFSEFMTSGDSVAGLFGGRILTGAKEIEDRLSELTEHSVRVTQRLLGNRFRDFEEFHAQNRGPREQWQVLVFRMPSNGGDRRWIEGLQTLLRNGPRCGVLPCILAERKRAADESLLKSKAFDHLLLTKNGEMKSGARWLAKGRPLQWVPSKVEREERERFLERIAELSAAREIVAIDHGNILKEAGFDLAKDPPRCSAEGLRIPIGRRDDGSVLSLELGDDVSHGLLGGQTGSGKSTLLHNLVTTTSVLYGRGEVELYLLDFKLGVEFEVYARHALPTARVVAIESDRYFGLSVLRRLHHDLEARRDRLTGGGHADFASFRAGGENMPRIMLVIDEFQVLFDVDDAIAREAGALLEGLLRQGRSFGVHVVLATQTINTASALSRAALSQIRMRIALMCDSTVSAQILGEGNTEASLLSQRGEAILNTHLGRRDRNLRFNGSLLRDKKVPATLHRCGHLWAAGGPKPFVFDGRTRPTPGPEAFKPGPEDRPTLVLGVASSLDGEARLAMERRPQNNLAAFLPDRAERVELVRTILHGLNPATVQAVDGTCGEQRLGRNLGGVQWESAVMLGDILGELQRELVRRRNEQPGPSRFLVIHGPGGVPGLKIEPGFPSPGTRTDGPAPGALFEEILREGPGFGIHVVLVDDSCLNFKRVLDPSGKILERFDFRAGGKLSSAEGRLLFDTERLPTVPKAGILLWDRRANHLLPVRLMDWSDADEKGPTDA